jgi:predicted ester cyclase
MRVLTSPFRWFASTRLAHSLRFRLILLVALATLPALGFLFLTSSQQRSSAIESAQEEANRLVTLVAIEQQGVIDQTQILLTVLARLPETQENDPAACNALTFDLQSGDESRYTSLGVVNADGSIFCGSPANLEASAIGDFQAVRRALDEGIFSIGNYQTSLDPAQRPTLTFAMPVRDDAGTIVRAVFASLDLSVTTGFPLQSNLRPGAVIMFLDSNGTLLFRQPALPEVSAGTSLVGTPVVDAVITGSEIRDDADYIYASDQIGGADASIAGAAYIIVAFPEAEIVAAADDAFQENVTRLGVAVLVALVAAWVGADLFIARDSETRKTLVSSLYHAFSSGSVAELDELFAPDYVDRSPAPGQRKGVEGVKQVVSAFRAAFPDGTIAPRELLADRDKVVARVTMTGTHLGEYYGMEPTGQRVTADGVDTYRFAGGTIVESWSLFGDFVPAVQLEEEVEPEPPKRGFFGRLAWWRR